MALLAAAVVVVLPLVGCSSGESQQLTGGAAAEGATTAPAAEGTADSEAVPRSTRSVRGKVPPLGQQAVTLRPARVDEVSEVAQAKVASVAVFQTPAGGKPWKTLRHPLASKAPLVFLVQEEKGDWLRVLVPVRPNQSQGWVRRKDVTLFKHDYRITISISKHELTVYQGPGVVMREQVGLGTSTTPTPGGVFYTKELIRPPKPDGAYGPYAYGLSGFSPVLNEFLGGDGEIGIHGTNDPAGIGKNVSHGCIRMRNEAITKLATMLPLGVPVQIMG